MKMANSSTIFGNETLRSTFNPRSNSIGFIRLAASMAVVIGHAFPYGGFGEDPLLSVSNNQTAIGRLPVDIFFSLSGFLITMSWEKSTSLLVFIWHRFLRIYPALWACVLLTAAILAPTFGAEFDYLYILRNSILVLGIDFKINGLFEGNPHTSLVNGALWTLPYEVWAYGLVACCGVAGIDLRKKLLVGLGLINWVILVTLIMQNPGLETSSAITSPCRLFSFFFVGATFYHYQDIIPISGKIATGCGCVLVGALVLGCIILPHSGGLFYIVAPVPLTYLVFWSAIKLPFQQVNTSTDLSYGVYIYGTLMLSILSKLQLNSNFWLYTGSAMVCSMVIAYCSWTFVEMPALSFKHSLFGRVKRSSVLG